MKALSPEAPQAPEAAFQYVQSLMGLRAWERAADAAGRLAFNDLHSNTSLFEDLGAFVASREACRAALPWSKRRSCACVAQRVALDSALALRCAAKRCAVCFFLWWSPNLYGLATRKTRRTGEHPS